MGLIERIFGGGSSARDRGEPAGAGASASTQFRESEPEPSDQPGSHAPRRELVQVVLRDTMRKHGIPSDWIECRVLSTVSRSGRRGLHVNFVVKKAHERLLAYVFAFQDNFERELARFDPRGRDWLLSLGWEFQGFNAAEMPDPHTWAQSGPAPLAPLAPPTPTKDVEASRTDDEIQRDLQALFAIRDAALAETAPKKKAAREEPTDFQPTQPFDDSGDRKK